MADAFPRRKQWRLEKEGRPEAQEPFLHWSMQYAFAQMQEAFEGVFENLEVPGFTWVLRGVVAPWSRLNTIGSMPDDELGGTLARAIQETGGAREWLSAQAYVPDDAEQPLSREAGGGLPPQPRVLPHPGHDQGGHPRWATAEAAPASALIPVTRIQCTLSTSEFAALQ